MDNWGGAIVGAAGAIGGSMASNMGSRKQQKRAQGYNVANWDTQNAYNHPSQQMARLREAGLNPNLIYGTSQSAAVGNADKIAEVKPADFNISNPTDSISNYAAMRGTQAKTDNTTQNTQLQREQELLTSAKTRRENINTLKDGLGYKMDKDMYNTSQEMQRAVLEDTKQAIIGKRSDNYVKTHTEKTQVLEAEMRVKNAGATLTGQQLKNELDAIKLFYRDLGIELTDNKIYRILSKNSEKITDYIYGFK